MPTPPLPADKFHEHEFIVIGSEHYTPLGAIRSLGEAEIRPIAIIRRGEYGFASLSKYIKTLHLVDDYEEAIEALSQYANETQKPFVIPCDDVIVSILDREYDNLADHFYFNNAGRQGRLSHFTEKAHQIALAEKHHLNIAKTWEVKGTGKIPSDILYPVITKPTYSYDNWKQDYHICNSRDELLRALSEVGGPVFLQQYIEKKTELALDGVSVDKGRSVLTAIESKYTYTLPDYYSCEMVVENCRDEKLKEALTAMLSEICYEGIFEAEFLVDKNDDLWFLEINFRNSTWSYASTCLGMNLPTLFAIGTIKGSIPPNAEKPIPEDYIALAELMDFFQRVLKYKMISPFQWLARVKRADCLFFYNKKDMRPFLSMCRHQILKPIRNLFVK